MWWNIIWENDFRNLWFEYYGYCGFESFNQKMETIILEIYKLNKYKYCIIQYGGW